MRALRLVPLTAVLVAAAASAARPVLRVNGTELTDTDLNVARQLVALQLRRQNPTVQPSPQDATRGAVEQLISQTLLLQAAKEAKVAADPVAVKAEIDQQYAQRGGAAFDQFLAGYGLTPQDYAKKVENQMVVKKFVDTVVASRVTVTETDARAFYDANPAKFEHPEEVRLRTILIKLDPKADEKQATAVQERAASARKRIAQGEDMAVVATSVSDDPSSARGGDIGWIAKGMLLPELEAAVWALKPGEVSEVLKSSLGYHIFKVEDRRPPGTIAFAEIKTKLTGILTNERLVAAVEALVKERRATAKIEPLDPAVSAALQKVNPDVQIVPPKPPR